MVNTNGETTSCYTLRQHFFIFTHGSHAPHILNSRVFTIHVYHTEYEQCAFSYGIMAILWALQYALRVAVLPHHSQELIRGHVHVALHMQPVPAPVHKLLEVVGPLLLVGHQLQESA